MAAKGLPPALYGIIGFVLGMLTVLLFLYMPSQQLLMQREQAINDMAEFNREEQERIRELRDVSTSEMLKWLAMAERTNTEFQKIQQSLHDQERALSNPGWPLITAMMVCVTSLTCFFLWVNWGENARDVATLQNFETFFVSRLEALAEEKSRVEELSGVRSAAAVEGPSKSGPPRA